MIEDAIERPSSRTGLLPQPSRIDETTINDADRDLAAKFGYKPVFKREFGYLATVSFAISIGAVFPSVATTFISPLQAGGSACIVWSWLISGAGCMCLALSVSELVSAYPTCGGLYYTVSRLAPKNYVPYISWVTGWLNLLGQAAGVAASEWGAASLLLAIVSIASDFTYLPTLNHTVAVMVAMVISSALVNSLSTYWLEKMFRFYVVFHILVLVTCCIALLAVARPENGTTKNSARYVFTDFTNQSGWQPPAWSFMFGFLSVSWSMSGYDATAHIAEEIKQPEIKTPWAITLGMLFTYLAGWLYNIVLCYVMGDISAPNSIIHSPSEQPVAQIFYNVLGNSGSVFYTTCALIILKFGNFAAMQSLTRTIFALSRDGLVPFSNTWTTISPSTGIPIYAVWLSALWAIGINLIGLGSYPAIAGVFNTTAIALDWSFCIPIFCKILFGKFEPGPWHLGRFSRPLNVYACVWTMFVSVIFLMPTTLPVRAETMNYAVVYIVAILLFATLYWVIRGKEHYTGPRIEVFKDTHNDEANESRPGQSKPPRSAQQAATEPTETRPLLGGT